MIRMLFTMGCMALFAERGLAAAVAVSAESGLKSWKVTDCGFSLELVQLQPEFVQATYAAREE